MSVLSSCFYYTTQRTHKPQHQEDGHVEKSVNDQNIEADTQVAGMLKGELWTVDSIRHSQRQSRFHRLHRASQQLYS